MMIDLQPTFLEDGLTKLLPLNENDFERLFAVASDPAIWEQHPSSDRYKKEVFKLYFEGAVKSGSAFLIFEKMSGDLIGSTRYYNYQENTSSIAIGYTFLAKKYWGGIYNRSVKQLLIDYAFQSVNTIFLHIGASNIRSQKAAQNIGAIKVNEIDFESLGKSTPHYEYEIKKENWQRIR